MQLYFHRDDTYWLAGLIGTETHVICVFQVRRAVYSSVWRRWRTTWWASRLNYSGSALPNKVSRQRRYNCSITIKSLCCSSCLKNCLDDIGPPTLHFWETLLSQFGTSGDICPEFHGHCGFPYLLASSPELTMVLQVLLISSPLFIREKLVS